MIRFSINNPVVVNLFAISVVAVGLFSMINLPREIMPPAELNWVYVVTAWPGASPEEVERLVTIPLEEELAGVDRIESLSSSSYQGRSIISIKFENTGEDKFRALLQDVQTEIDQVKNLPAGIESPLVLNFTTDDFLPLINVTLSSKSASSEDLNRVARGMRSEIKLLGGVRDIHITGEREMEVWVEIDPARLLAVGIPLSRVVDAIAQKNVGYPVGRVTVGAQEYLLRMTDEFQSAADVAETIIAGDEYSGLVRVRDIATVRETLEERETATYFNGNPAVSLVVTKVPGASSLTVIESIKSYVDTQRATGDGAAANIQYDYTGDTSRQINGILGILQRNAIVGLALVILTLYFFLGFRNALFAAFGVPITFMVTFIFLHVTGNSLNGNSLFGLVLVLGVVVDDAIIVIENAYSYIEKGMEPVQAACRGAREVATPVLAATATTVAGFLPLMLMPGIMGKFLKIVPIVVSLALIASLFEAFLVLPSHIAEWSKRKREKSKAAIRRQKLFRKLNLLYVPLVCKAVRYRYLVFAGFCAILSMVFPILDHLGVEMFRDEELPSILVQVRMPPSTSLSETEQMLREMESRLTVISQEDILGVTVTAGYLNTQTERLFKSSVGQIQFDLRDIQERAYSNDAMIVEMRSALKNVVGPVSIAFEKIATGPPVGSPLEVKVKGKYLAELLAVAEELRDSAATIPGVYDVAHNFGDGKRQITFAVDHAAAARVGINASEIAREMGIAFEGLEATSYRDGDEERAVIVKFNAEFAQSLETLRQMRLTTASGRQVALSDLTTMSEGVGIDEIKRFNQERSITVTGENDPDIVQIDKIAAKVETMFAGIQKSHPEYKLDFGGEWDEFKKAFDDLGRLFIVGILLIYMILGAQFKSFLQPFIILVTVPFAVLGAVVGLLVLGAPFSIATMYGIVALAGIAVNDSLVLVDFINKGRRAGATRYASIIRAGKRRLRPILSTSITTVFGLLPMAIGIGGKSVVWGPLATTIVWGLSVATILTLFVIPSSLRNHG
ncbi:efflux RND transporter permease subunit [bacterium AH-315-F03]|nr:efflux RND transporter permease subunit [bacterium AH-315-F03]